MAGSAAQLISTKGRSARALPGLERAREQTLARARLPLNENRRQTHVAVLEELSRLGAEGGHGRAVAEQLGQGLHRAPASRSKAASRLRWQWLASSQ